MTQGKILAIISVTGNDQKGVVARVCTYLAEQGINIEDIDQRVVQGLFVMGMLVDMSDMAIPLDELMAELSSLGASMKMEIKVRLLGRRRERTFVAMVTKEAHCLERLIADTAAGRIDASISAVLSNHDTLEPMAREAGLPFIHFTNPNRTERDHEILAKLDELKPDLVVLARYMQILPEDFVRRWPSKIINIHPSLLPFHPGANAYRQAFEQGRRVAGCTAHFVTEVLDEGPIIMQDVFHIAVGEDTLDDVKRKGQSLESATLAKAVELYFNEELVVKDNKVVFKPGLDFFKKHGH